MRNITRMTVASVRLVVALDVPRDHTHHGRAIRAPDVYEEAARGLPRGKLCGEFRQLTYSTSHYRNGTRHGTVLSASNSIEA